MPIKNNQIANENDHNKY